MVRICLLTLLSFLTLLSCQVSNAVLIFPVSGSVMSNPVYFEANRVVTWFVDGTEIGVGKSWSGRLNFGERTITADTVTFKIFVQEDFPLGVPRAFGSNEQMSLPEGDFAVVIANNTEDNLDAKSETKVNFVERLHSRIEQKLQRGVTRIQPRVRLQSIENRREFRILNPSTLQATVLPFRLVEVTPRAAAYVEESSFDGASAAVKGILKVFEAHILERVSGLFGTNSDVNSDGRVLLVFSSVLNRSGLAVGYFNALDLLARDKTNPDSNEAEVLYLGTPDKTDVNFATASLEATACHELQHLINFSRKTLQYLEDQNPPFESVAVNEGLSHLAEDLCGYNISGGNLLFAHRFLAGTPSTLTGGSDTVERRGGMYLLLRFLFEQAGGAGFFNGIVDFGGVSFLRRVIASSSTGLENLAIQSGIPIDTLLWRFWWSLRIDTQFSSFATPEIDLITGQERGIRMKTGDMTIAGRVIHFSGAKLLQKAPQNLPPQAAAFLRVGRLDWTVPIGWQVQVIRLSGQ